MNNEEKRYTTKNPDSYLNFLEEKKSIINSVSPTFCLAKWLQSTILLYSGETHSCHHPSRHKITAEDIKDNPKGIHNTSHKLKERQDMLEGIQTPECDYCWNIENLKHDHVSDRIYKSTFSWTLPYLDEVIESGTGKYIDPTYLEVAFEHTCNLKCLYCSPESSSAWEREIENFGPIKQTNHNLHDLKWLKSVGKLPIPADAPNPYIDAFWEWWPTLYPKLITFRITGGEPLLSEHTWKVFDYIKEHANPNMVLAINTNCMVPDSTVDRLIEAINLVTPNVERVDIYTSIESTGKHAEYTRHGLDYEKFVSNCYKILDNTPVTTRIHLMTTINVTSAPTFIDFLKLINKMREEYYDENNLKELHQFRIRTHLSYLRWPLSLQLTLLSNEDKEKYGDEWIKFIEDHKLVTKEEDPEHFMQKTFYLEEVDQVSRLVEYMKSKKEENSVYDDMRLYITQCDSRRTTNFNETFSELSYLMDNNYYGN